MPDQDALSDLLDAARRWLAPRVAEDPALRTLVRAAARALAEIADPSDVRTPASTPPRPSPADALDTRAASTPPVPPLATPPAPVNAASPPPSAPGGYVPLALGGEAIQVRVAGTTADLGRARLAASASSSPSDEAWSTDADLTRQAPIDLELIATRCRLKSEACVVAASRRAEGYAPDSGVKARLDAMLQEAKALPSCFLWMFFRERPLPDDAVLARLGACYDVLGAAAGYVHALQGEGHAQRERAEGCALLAEAQSMLRIALADTWLTMPDADQDAAFRWLQQYTVENRVYVERYMRLDDPADPAHAPALLADVRARVQREAQARDARKKQVALINKVRYHAKRVLDDAAAVPEWSRLDDALASALRAGIPSSDTRLRDAVRPVAAAPPPPGHKPSASLAQAFVAAKADAPDDTDDNEDDQASRPLSPIALSVARALAGKRAVLVGGEPRENVRLRLEGALNLDHLTWTYLREHASSAPAVALAERSDVDIVLILIRLAGHQQVDDLAEACRRLNKPFVRVPRGFSVEQIALAVHTQIGRRLGIPGAAEPGSPALSA